MKVKELISWLEAFNPNAKVLVSFLGEDNVQPLGDVLAAYKKNRGGYCFVDSRGMSGMKDEKAVLLEGGEE